MKSKLKVYLALVIIFCALIFGFSLYNQKPKVVDGKVLNDSISANSSWKILADWNFGDNTESPTRFQGKAYYVDNGANYLWIDHGMGSTIPVRVFNGSLDAPTESPPMVGVPITDKKAKLRLEHDLFNMSPLLIAEKTGVVFKRINDNEFSAQYTCVGEIKKIYNCLTMDYSLKLNSKGKPETLILKIWHSKKLSDKISFFFSDYGVVDMVEAEESIDFVNLLPPDYDKMAADLNLGDKTVEELKKLVEEGK